MDGSPSKDADTPAATFRRAAAHGIPLRKRFERKERQDRRRCPRREGDKQWPMLCRKWPSPVRAEARTPPSRSAFCPKSSSYIDANFKETQLADLRPGQPVAIAVDAYSDHKLEGNVVSVVPASGSVFFLLPPDNATGNFTKIVQRLPVRIEVPAPVAERGLLRPGMSVVKPGAVARNKAIAARTSVTSRRVQSGSTGISNEVPMASARNPTATWNDLTAADSAAPAGTADSIEPRRLIAFLAMVFGMFMAILDIQIVSASLTEIQAGLAIASGRLRKWHVFATITD